MMVMRVTIVRVGMRMRIGLTIMRKVEVFALEMANDDEDDGMSEYCSDDHCEIVNESDEELVDDPLKGHAIDMRLKNDHVTNNISESFNNWVGELQGRPVLTLLDGLRAKLMSCLQTRREKALKWSNSIAPNIVKVLNDARDESRNCKLLVAD
ncbi:hypothetical protein Salat_2510300 [Sesamum alatum]|uniref:Uncharacterized protein n=1 Tax=Sesamum alatum TaxID=300844 RepID=A0AAE1XSN5_9LAMI|nr:hypothetical protein Salat_2510300 [Sesamum alatum]